MNMYFKILLLFILFFSSFSFYGLSEEKIDVIYKYKKYERFDFENFSIDGVLGGPGDLSINPRIRRRFSNKLPYRKDFKDKIRKAVESIR